MEIKGGNDFCNTPEVQLGTRWALIISLLITWIFWSVGLFHCTFLEINGQNYGIYRVAVQGDDGELRGCIPYRHYPVYHDAELDFFSVAQTLGQIFGGMGIIINFFSLGIFIYTHFFWNITLSPIDPASSQQTATRTIFLWMLARMLLIISFIFLLLTFSFTLIEECEQDHLQCNYGSTGYVAVVTIPLMILNITLSWYANPPSCPVLYFHDAHSNDIDRGSNSYGGGKQKNHYNRGALSSSTPYKDSDDEDDDDDNNYYRNDIEKQSAAASQPFVERNETPVSITYMKSDPDGKKQKKKQKKSKKDKKEKKLKRSKSKEDDLEDSERTPSRAPSRPDMMKAPSLSFDDGLGPPSTPSSYALGRPAPAPSRTQEIAGDKKLTDESMEIVFGESNRSMPPVFGIGEQQQQQQSNAAATATPPPPAQEGRQSARYDADDDTSVDGGDDDDRSLSKQQQGTSNTTLTTDMETSDSNRNFGDSTGNMMGTSGSVVDSERFDESQRSSIGGSERVSTGPFQLPGAYNTLQNQISKDMNAIDGLVEDFSQDLSDALDELEYITSEDEGEDKKGGKKSSGSSDESGNKKKKDRQPPPPILTQQESVGIDNDDFLFFGGNKRGASTKQGPS